MLNLLSVDVEDYHDQLALDFQRRIVPPNVEALRCTHRLLDLFAELGVKGTFFILGSMAESFPDLIRRIAADGHHLGIHGYHHHHVFDLSPPEFRESISRAKQIIEDLAGREADAYRATAFSINQQSGTMWAMKTLIDLGFKYDASFFPWQGRRYGNPGTPRGPHRFSLPDGRSIWEVPASVVVKWGRPWPVCGGGYLRHLPLWITRRAIRALNAEGLPAVIYLHPYETETRPVIHTPADLPFAARCHFHFFNFHQRLWRRRTLPKLRDLLTRYPFGTVEEVVADFDRR